jgi:hypothetical protein
MHWAALGRPNNSEAASRLGLIQALGRSETYMRIEYKNRFTDIVLFQAVHQFLSPVVQGFCVLLAVLVFQSEAHLGAFAAAVSAFSVYGAIWLAQFLFNAIYFLSKSNKTVLAEHVIELQDESLLEQTKFNKSYFYWPGVVKAVSRPGFVAIYVTPQMAHVIPNRFFSSKTHRSSFLALAQEKIRAGTA